MIVGVRRNILASEAEALHFERFSARRGFCGTCRTRVISGEIDHRDRVLTERERTDTMTICVSRGRGGRIALDL